jgi:hypothetical protein
MTPTKFAGVNVVYAENQPEYLPLPVHRCDDGTVTSCWTLSWRERLVLLLRGRFFISVLTFNGPLQPVIPTVTAPLHMWQDRGDGVLRHVWPTTEQDLPTSEVAR